MRTHLIMPLKDKYVGPDPDPAEFLYVSLTLKAESASKPYDAKKACWVPCAKDGFVQGEIRGAKGDQITVLAANKVMTLIQNYQKNLIIAGSAHRCKNQLFFPK